MMAYLICFFSLTLLAQGETAGGNNSGAVAAPATGSTAVPAVPVKPAIPNALDSSFFGKAKGPKPSETRGDRYDGAEPEYNTEQLQNWKDECKKEIKNGMAEYRKCFNAAKARDLGAIKQQALDVERRQSYPLGNVPAPVQEYQQTPSDGD